MSELWENYIIHVLEEHLKPPYRIVAGNFEEDEFLLQGPNRQLKPDIIIYKEGDPVAILDAKYKAYHHFGRQHGKDVSREDLYQMSTYLLHYSLRYGTRKLIGLFVSPTEQREDDSLHPYSGGSDLATGLLNLNLTQVENTKEGVPIAAQMREVEAAFAGRLKECICNL
jgi:5-methylcytosine-specific restriction endonuclease McrBC regulatory subunit McrC